MSVAFSVVSWNVKHFKKGHGQSVDAARVNRVVTLLKQMNPDVFAILARARFDVITLSYEHGFAKPHSSIFDTTLERLGVDADRCLHVGDNPISDIQGAREAGLKTARAQVFYSLALYVR